MHKPPAIRAGGPADQTFLSRRFSAEWEWLQARAAEDPRVVLVVESLQRDELLALYGCCDVCLSLHRSEGFGRGMAEALQLGVDVIANDFGGNTDFCTGPLAHPVRWRKAPIPRGSYPNADGHNWAEPDLGHAAELCQQVAASRLAAASNSEISDPRRDCKVLANYRKKFSFVQVGNKYRARLQVLWDD
ncbi:glycosyltransferase [bacterium]|nr:glycosyltransferase [bacterium]